MFVLLILFHGHIIGMVLPVPLVDKYIVTPCIIIDTTVLGEMLRNQYRADIV